MTRLPTQPPHSLTLLITMVVLLSSSVLTSCGRRDEVSVLDVPKEPPPNLTMPTGSGASAHQAMPALQAHMLAAIVPKDQRFWFFKMMGSPADVKSQQGEFRKLLESLSFDEQDEPLWNLPESWTEQPGTGMRKATLTAGSGAHAPSVSVIGLAAPQDVLSNVNRWRNQLQLPPLNAEELTEYVDTFAVAETEVTLADIAGTVNPQASMDGSMAGNMTATSTPKTDAGSRSSEAPAETGTTDLTYETPPGWSSAAAGGMRKAAFTVSDGETKAEFTVISLPPFGGELLPNVNRWRTQLGLEPLDEQSVNSAVRSMPIGGHDGQYVELMMENSEDGGQATLAAMVPHGGAIWFFKLTGNHELVQREESNFETFLDSVEFTD